MYRKGQEARLAYLGHVLVENCQGLIVDPMATTADGTAAADAALLITYRWRQEHWRRVMLVAGRADDRRDLVETLRQMDVVVHVAQKRQGSALDRGQRGAPLTSWASGAGRYWSGCSPG